MVGAESRRVADRGSSGVSDMASTQGASEIHRVVEPVRPFERPIGYHTWSNLAFLHWALPPEEIAPLLPPGLTLDTFAGRAWVGLVPFEMARVRPWWSPAVPGISWFCETNVRTYVHIEGRDPGVWFFSLDASNAVAVTIARWCWHLNYWWARMQTTRTGTELRYASQRIAKPPGTPSHALGFGTVELSLEVGDLLGAGSANRAMPPGRCVPGSLEQFLIDRYTLYAARRDGRLLRGAVYHEPYRVRTATVRHCRQSLIAANGIAGADRPPDHVAFCDGVDVDIFPLRTAT